MHAAVLHEYGNSPCYEDFPDPAPEAHEALVHVTAAAVTPVARSITQTPVMPMKGLLPFIPGVEGVGTLGDGRRVSFAIRRPPYGSMGQLTVAPQDKVFPIPDAVDDVNAAAAFHPGITSWLSLSWLAKVTAGDAVLVLGASGSAGRAAVQVACLLGAGKVIAAGRDPEILRKLPRLGADAVVDLNQPDAQLADAFAAHAPYDVIMDYLWGRPAQILLGALPVAMFVTGSVRFVQLGHEAGRDVNVDGFLLRRAGVSILNPSVSPPDEVVRQAYENVLKHVGNQGLRIPYATAPLSDVESAWTRDTAHHRLVFTV